MQSVDGESAAEAQGEGAGRVAAEAPSDLVMLVDDEDEDDRCASCGQIIPETDETLSAVDRDLALLPDELAQSGLAASARALARELDRPNSATSKSMCARALHDALDRLRDLAPPRKTHDRLDEVNEKREQRRSHHRAADA